MGFTLHRSVMPSLSFLLLSVAMASCGRIPPLDDAAVPVQPDAALVFRDAAPDAPIVCNTVTLSTAKHVLADVLVVLDRSGSMNFSINQDCSCDPSANPAKVCDNLEHCVTRWSTLAVALDIALSSAPTVQWGLKLFSSPNTGSCGVTQGVEVPLGLDTRAAIKSQIAAISPEGDTPTAAAIRASTAYLDTVPDSNSKVILLATDGDPNCGGTSPTVYDVDVDGTTQAITQARESGYLVYVIGIGFVGNLEVFAQAGGTGSYYPGQSPEQLSQALGAISRAAGCTFAIDAAPSDPSSVGVYLDKNLVPQDSSNGWTFGATPRSVVLHGSSCDKTLLDTATVVQVLFLGCNERFPSTLP
jgi:hypothetical protein